MAGTAARAPVAMTARRKRKRCPPGPPTSISSGETKHPCPRKTSTPSPAKRWALSLPLIPARRRRMRSMAVAKSPGPAAIGPPKRSALWRASLHERAARITPLEGTQPTLRQSPPIRCRSTIADRAPSPAAPAAETSPAVPAPIATRWYRPAGCGMTQPAGWTFSISLRLWTSSGWIIGSGGTRAGSGMGGLRGRLADLLPESLSGQAGDEGGDDQGGGEADPQGNPVGRSLLDVTARRLGEAARRVAVVDVEQGAGEHGEAGEQVVEEAHPGEPQGVVEQVEGENR